MDESSDSSRLRDSTIETPTLMPKYVQSKSVETLADMSSVRWLAELCCLPSAGIFPNLATSLLQHEGPATAYVSWWIRHPDRGSMFEKATRHLADMPDEMLVTALEDMGYDGLLYQGEDEIVGHVFFQRHGTDLCAFSSSVGERYRGGKLWATLSIDFVAFSSQLADVKRARVGAGNHPITRQLVALLKPHVRRLGWSVSKDGWVDFSVREP